MSQSEQYPVHPGGSDVNPARYAKTSIVWFILGFGSGIGMIVFWLLAGRYQQPEYAILFTASIFLFLLSTFAFCANKILYHYRRYGLSGMFDPNEAIRVAQRNAVRDIILDLDSDKKRCK